ncbi:Dyp-type peroxidase [Kitasatospora sp. NPDC089509]|uniref:Dyp-type peroxidase n=1 Tax=Kitasatospora sp. NPDC089509 TaxID=3364079 RepID=UPI00380424E0
MFEIDRHATQLIDPALPLRSSEDIQGDILAGFRKDHQCLLMIQFEDTGTARQWLRLIVPEIASTRVVAEFNAAFSAARREDSETGPVGMSADWTGLSVTYPGLVLLSDADPFRSAVSCPAALQAFREGAAARARKVGDTGVNGPGNWLFGAGSRPVIHAVLTLASDDPVWLAAAIERHCSVLAAHGATVVSRQDGATLPGPLRGHEHFGFADGVSQPAVQGFHQSDPDDPQNVLGSPGTRILPASRFVIGADQQAQAFPPWAIGGSFQVIRRLAQDVAGWRAQLGPQLEILKKSGAVPDTADDVWLAARMVGRWPSGTPIARCPMSDIPPPPGEKPDNDLSYRDDPDGTQTPLFSHIRKTNPRDDQSFLPEHSPDTPFSGSDPRRIIRRGIPFGPPFDPRSADPIYGADTPRGLLFVCYQADLVEQFEFLQHTWVNNARFPRHATGADPLIGNVNKVSFRPRANGATRSISLSLDQFVRTEGAIYAFTPAISVLYDLAFGNVRHLL